MSDHDFDLDELMEELASRLEEPVQEAVEAAVDDLLEDRVDGAVHDAVQDILPEIFSQCLADFDFVLKDGTVVRPRQRMKVLSPDKSKLLICYGGLRVDGKSLIIQTRISSWEWIADYPDREAAVAALKLVHEAMKAGEPLLELP